MQELLLVLFSAWLVRYFALEGMSLVYMTFVCIAWCVCGAGLWLPGNGCWTEATPMSH